MPTIISGTSGVSQVQDGSVQLTDFPASFFEASLGTNGYQRLPSGLIIQWGTTPSGTSGTVIFPTAFTTACVAVMTTNASTGNQSLVSAKTTTQFTWSNSNTVVTNWIAIGY